jgi:hypothetical protein
VSKHVLFVSKKQNAVLLTLQETVNMDFSPSLQRILWLERLWISSLLHLCEMDLSWIEFPAPIRPRVAGILISVSAAVLTMPKFHRLKWFLFNVIYWPISYSTLICIHMKSFSMSNLVLKYVLFVSKKQNAVFACFAGNSQYGFFTKVLIKFVT